MNVWLYEHSCGTAACVCGYQALSSDLSLFERAIEADECDGSYEGMAMDISIDLDASCEELFGNESLAQSIYKANYHNRFNYAAKAQVADREALEKFRHLTSSYPSLEDAITYLEFVIEKCKEKSA